MTYGYGINPDCHYGDHEWRGGGVCVSCGERLRCNCGRFIRSADLDAHVVDCPWVVANLEPDDSDLSTQRISQ